MRGPVLIAAAILIALVFFQTDDSRTAAQTPGLVRVFIDLPGRPQAIDRAAVTGLGGRVRNEFFTSNTISVEVPAIALPILQAALPARFSHIREVPRIEAVEDQLDWGVNQTDAERVWGGSEGALNVSSGGNGGAGVKVGVIDTGIMKTHPDLLANLAGGRNWVAAANGSVNTNNWGDDNGHGTHVAGTIGSVDNGTGMIGVAPKVSLYGLKVLAASGSGYLDDAAAAVEWATGLNGGTKLDVVNLSFGCVCDFAPMKAAVDYAYSHGVVVVAAAGNNGGGADTMIYPAKYDSVIAVAATCGPTRTSYCPNGVNTRPTFSSQGPRVEIAAPGDAIRSTYNNGGYATMSGTSMASPHVAGVVALVRAANPGWTTQQVRDRLNSTAIDLGAAGRDNSFGYGLVSAAAAVGITTTPPDDPPPGTRDLSIVAMSASPPSVTAGTLTTISISVRNEGAQAESGVALTLQDGSTGPVVSSTTFSVGVGATTVVPLSWNTTGATTGLHQLTARVATLPGETDTADNSYAISVSVNAQVQVQDTGYRSCNASSAVLTGSGDNNGFETNPGNACADDTLFAQDTNSGSASGTSCSSTAKDRHVFSNYGMPVSSGSTITSINVRLDAWVDFPLGARYLCVELSWDGGTSWTAPRTTSPLTMRQTTYILGGNNWGRTWTASDLSDANFRVRVTSISNNNARDFCLDWVAVRVVYQ